MGRTSGKKRRNNKAGSKAGAGPSANGSALVGPVNLHLVAEPEFYEAADSAGCPGSLKDHCDDGLPGLLLVLEDVGKLADLLGWFAAGAAEDANAKLDFPASLSSAQRAEIHQLVSGKFGDKLEAYSSGVVEARHISVCKKGCAPSRELSAEQEAKVAVLYPVAKEAALSFTRDEIADCILQGQLPGPLEEVWQSSGKRLWLSQQLCNAAALGNVAALQALVAEDASVLRESVKEPQQGALPLQSAAIAGQVEALRALAGAGADLEAVDGAGQTPLQAARRAEQCDAEAVLLQLGAVDPDADVMPVTPDANGTGGDDAEEAVDEEAPEEEATATTQEAATATTQEEATATTQEEATATTQEEATATTQDEATATTQEEATATTQEEVTATTQDEAAATPSAASPQKAAAGCGCSASSVPQEAASAAPTAAPATECAPSSAPAAAVAAPPAPAASTEPAVSEPSSPPAPVASTVVAVSEPSSAPAPAASTMAAVCEPSSAPAPAAGSAAAVCEQMRSSVAASSSSGAAAAAAAAPQAEAEAKGGLGCVGDVGGGWSTASVSGVDRWAVIGAGVALTGVAAWLLLRRR